jgi:acetyl esterase
MLDPHARALLDLIAERGVPPTHTLTPDEARRAYRERRFYTQPEAPPLPEVRALEASTPHGPVALRLYRPAGLPAAAPVLVYFHGGGWTIGDLDTHDVLCRELAIGAACAVVAVDYRLGPEHRFPAAVDDALGATRWLQAEAAALGLDPARLALGGDSAGGTLATAVAILLRDAGAGSTVAPAPRLQLLIYPATDMRAIAPSHASHGDGYLLTRETIAYFCANYLGDAAHATDWRASPLLQPRLDGLPPALVVTAGFDPLRDEGRQYADALSAGGTPTQYVCFERQIHGFITMGKVIPEARTAVDLCAAALRRAFS